MCRGMRLIAFRATELRVNDFSKYLMINVKVIITEFDLSMVVASLNQLPTFFQQDWFSCTFCRRHVRLDEEWRR